MSETQHNVDVQGEEDRGTAETVPEKTPDATLRLTDDGIEMPEFLKGFIGEFKIRTPNVTGEFETTPDGLPDEEYYDGVIAAYPEAGDYHSDLTEGVMAISTEDHPEAVYQVLDSRSE